jgi:hypothetical protein
VALPIDCERCKAPLHQAIHIPAVGESRGAYIYRCEACGHSTWRWIEPKSQAPQRVTRQADPLHLPIRLKVHARSERNHPARILSVAALGNVGMSRADDFQRQAEFCEHQAAKTGNKTVREQFQTLARQWRELAQSAEFIDHKPPKPP